jgi:hypothetical protein
MRFLTSFAFICLLCTFGTAQNCQDAFEPKKALLARSIICPEVMQADLAQLHKHILETHPNPTYYVDINTLSAAYRQAKTEIQNPLNVFEFLIVINTYLSVLKDSHTGINPKQFLYNTSLKTKVLPFFVENIDDNFFISSSFNKDFDIGAELVQIDSFPINKLYHYALKLSLIEGDAVAAKNEIASEYISIAYNLLSMGIEKDKSARVHMVTAEGDTLTKEIDFSSSWRYLLSGLLSKTNDEVFSYFDQNNNGILVVESFQPLSLAVFKKRIDAFFEQVESRNCQSVYIDLRNNLGGQLRAQEYLFSYINTKQVPIKTNYLYKRSDFDRFALLTPMQQIQFVNRAKNVYPNGLISKEYDFYRLPKGTTHNILYDYLPQNNRNSIYKGTCSLVLNGNSMSASVLFAAWFKHIERGLILGTPCMGGMGGTFGNPAIISLHHSKIDVMVSTLKFTPYHIQEPVLNAIEPDISIKINRSDLIERRDPFEHYLKSYHKE